MNEIQELSLENDILLSRTQRILHEVASASISGVLLASPFAILLTSLIFLIPINLALNNLPSWKNKIKIFPETKQVQRAMLASNRSLSYKTKAYRNEYFRRIGLRLTKEPNHLRIGKLSLVPNHFKSPPGSTLLYFCLQGRQIEKNQTDATSPYTTSYAILAIEVVEQINLRLLRGHLWVAVVDASKHIQWSPKKEILFLEQQRWLLQLWPTRSLAEPGSAGRWMVHYFRKILKSEFAAGALSPEKRNRVQAQKFINHYLYSIFARQKTLAEQTFWTTFMNGTNGWGFIQWFTTFLAMLSLLMLGARYLLVSSEISTLEYWSNISPLDLKQQIRSPWIHKLRYEASRGESEIPQPRLLATLNLVDEDTFKDSDYVQVRLESSRRVVEFLINSLASIGFIGTITGIAFAINQAHLVVTPDEFIRIQAIKSLSSNLALAFSTSAISISSARIAASARTLRVLAGDISKKPPKIAT